VSFEWFVARRYLTARRKQAFISLISGVSILGVGVGVMALVIALGLMTGVQTELQEHINGYTAHVYVYKTDGEFTDADAEVRRFVSMPGVEGAAPAIRESGLLSAPGAASTPVDIWGIDPALQQKVIKLDAAMQTGSVSALAQRTASGRDGILLGADLAQKLGVARGDEVTLVTPHGRLSPLGMLPFPRSFTVVGTFRFGFYEFDQASVFLSLAAAERAFNIQGPDLVQLRLQDMNEAPAFRERLQQQLGRAYVVEDWVRLNSSLYSALGLEKLAISLTIGLIVVVAALNIVASLVLLVMEKSRDIAILRTMGAPARAIRRIFVYQGLTIGLIGTFTGTMLGLLVCHYADRYQLISLPADIYQISYLPFRVLPLDVAVVVLGAIAVCFLATLYPSRQAGRLDPSEALRNQ
jgi:lipoprotein-releasing system permease protein